MAALPITPPALVAVAVVAAALAVGVWRKFPMSYTMAVASIGVFVVQLVSQQLVVCVVGGMRQNCVIAELGFVAPVVADGDNLLTPFMYMFVHADLFHIAGNLFILLTAGPALEDRIGTRNFTVLYLVAGLGAALASALLWLSGFFTQGQEFSPNVGASGAIFGVLTGFATLFPRERLPMVMPMVMFVFWMPAFTVLLLYLAINLVYVFSSTNIAWWGHFAGFLVGLALAPVLHGRIPALRLKKGLDVDLEAVRPLATTNVQRSALRELERLRHPQTPDDRALAEAWWERFVSRAECPRCQRRLELRDGSLVCPVGDFEVRALRA